MKSEFLILDSDYLDWVKELSARYRKSQIKAAVKVNQEMLRFYWELGKDIVKLNAENKYGSNFYTVISTDLKRLVPNASGLSPSNIRYAKRFFELYSSTYTNFQQLAEKSETNLSLSEKMLTDLFSVPWGHHMLLIDKCSDNTQKALFFVHQTVENGWSRATLLNFLSSDLYERQGKALTNFKNTLPDMTSDLAQELTKDPYDFAFTGITGRYNERLLKDKLLNNITNFLVELGTGFAYVGKEYRLQVGEREQFIDLLFYNLQLSCYVVIEVKIGKFEFADIGQLGGYVVSCNHILRKEGRDNPTIGLLICKEKDKIQAQYALESSSQPIGISEYELERFYPEKVEGTIPTIEEIEKGITRLAIYNEKGKEDGRSKR
ncbi:MAG: PDDEXK nuclease domain-containing protein [Treponema sp.]|nr:PDDEXK nuclease domain-containing protein [Treponema sp.]